MLSESKMRYENLIKITALELEIAKLKKENAALKRTIQDAIQLVDKTQDRIKSISYGKSCIFAGTIDDLF